MTRARQMSAALARREAVKHCAAVTCRDVLTPGRVFCRNHWFCLPKWLRDSILETFIACEWDAYQEDVRRAADHIDAAHVAARDAGFQGIVSGLENRAGAVWFWKAVA